MSSEYEIQTPNTARSFSNVNLLVCTKARKAVMRAKLA